MAAHRRSGSLRRTILGTAAFAGAGVAAVSTYARANRMLGPTELLKYVLTPNSQVGRLFPARIIERAPVPREFAQDLRPIAQLVPWKNKFRGISRVLRETKTNAFLVARDGVLVHSWMRERFTTTTPHSSWSVAKSVVGLVVGQLIDEGKLREETRLVEVIPEIATGGLFDLITVQHLLDMQAGIDLDEDYTVLKPYTGVAGMLSTTDLLSYLRRNQEMYATPGEVTEYRSVDTQYLSMVVSRIEQSPLAEVVEKRIWGPIGAHDTAFWNLDAENGIEKGFAALNATARDYLKLGQLMLDRGRVGDTQVVPSAWIDRIQLPVGHPIHDQRSWGYSAQWWHPEGSEHYGDFTALGVYGQYVYVNPAHNVVIVKLSDYGAEQDEDRMIRVFRSIAARGAH